MRTDLDLAWAAGILDGEGSIGIYRRFPKQGKRSIYYRLSVQMDNTHKLTIKKIQSIMGVGSVRMYPTKGKDVWRWGGYDANGEKALRMLMPYLVTKKAQAEMALDFRALMRATAYENGSRGLSSDTIAQRDAYYWKLREMK